MNELCNNYLYNGDIYGFSSKFNRLSSDKNLFSPCKCNRQMDFYHQEVEARWKAHWAKEKTYKVSNTSKRPKFYVLDMFPYPSGSGLHVGHPLGYIASDIYARYKFLKGFNVLHPMGYDAFGLPAEQYAIQTGVHPAESTDENIKRYRAQLENLGFNYDWEREVKTSDPSYYKWTQWIFIQLFDHYYDQEIDMAVPINELIKKFEQNGNTKIKASSSQETIFSADEWKHYTSAEKDEVLMNYRLAYRKISYVNWCEELGTVLANDEVKDGVSERGGFPVERRAMKQWSLRITAYAERLLKDLDSLDWSDSLKLMQQNWIGRSEGAQVFFKVKSHDLDIEIFTTRPDTIFGASFMVLAPEHDIVEKISTGEQRNEIEEYVKYASGRSDRDRMTEVNKVTGAFTGAFALHPFTGEEIPIWISDYVLKDYGTGAIMAVPSDDERDYKFATHYKLPVIPVVSFKDVQAKIGSKDGIMINSSFLNGLEVHTAIETIIQKMEERGLGSRKVNYKLRDANFSRQRYWGEPFPIYYDDQGVAHALSIDELPLELPVLDDFKPGEGGKSPLARLENWVEFKSGYTRETDTMPGFAGSSWYFLRYMDAHNNDQFASKEAIDYWQDVDLYIGGTEHAVGHLMYSRFWHKFLFDKGLCPTPEPFKKLINQGMIQGVIEYIFMFKEKVDDKSRFISADLAAAIDEPLLTRIPVHVDFVQNYGSENSYLNEDSIRRFIEWRPEYRDAIFETGNGIYQLGAFTPSSGSSAFRFLTQSEVGKMSKRYFNVVNPDVVAEKYGADCFRMYEMFLGPIEQSKPWDTKGIDGVFKFLRKFWGMFFDTQDNFIANNEKASPEALKILHTVIKKVSEDIEKFSFNTCVSAFMVAVNELRRIECKEREILEPLTILLAPFAPFMTEELWTLLGKEGSIHHREYPVFDPAFLVEDSYQYPICINGKKKDLISFPLDMKKEAIEHEIMNMESVQKYLEGKVVKKVIFVPKRMINIVV